MILQQSQQKSKKFPLGGSRSPNAKIGDTPNESIKSNESVERTRCSSLMDEGDSLSGSVPNRHGPSLFKRRSAERHFFLAMLFVMIATEMLFASVAIASKGFVIGACLGASVGVFSFKKAYQQGILASRLFTEDASEN